VLDKFKGWLISIVLGGGILLFIQWAYTATGGWFWIIVMGGLSFFMIFMAMFYVQLFVPLFNKLTPLEDGELKSAIEQFSEKAGFKLDNIYVIDGSKRSTKANAYFSGLGSKKRIILYDTLINDLSTEEIVAVLAHEVGHYRRKHIIKGLAMSLVQTGVMVGLLWYALSSPELSFALGAKEPSFHMGLLAFAFLFSPISFITGIISNLFSRKHEYQADAFAREKYDSQKLIDALIKLSVKSLSNLRPHPLYVFFNYSHPTLLQRMEKLK
jgi:STE24 endopeptidase